MKKQLSIVRFSVAAQITCFFLLNATLTAQETSISGVAEPIVRNTWEDIYSRIAGSFSAPSLLELLKSMALERNQAELASSYAVILKDQIYSYPARYKEEPIYMEAVITFLLDKISEQAEIIMQENPEIANVIGLSLIPDLGYNAVMGKANYTLGRLGAEEFSESVLRRLEDINNIMTTDGSSDDLGLNYFAAGCLEALIEFRTPSAFPVLFQVKHDPFSKIVRNRAAYLIKQLEKEYADEVRERFITFVMIAPQLSHLNMIVDSIDEGEFDPKAVGEINLALLTRINESTRSMSPAYSANIKTQILQKTIDNILIRGVDSLKEKSSEQLEPSYLNSDNMNIKLLALQAIGKLNSDIRCSIFARGNYPPKYSTTFGFETFWCGGHCE